MAKEFLLKEKTSSLTENYLQSVFKVAWANDNILLNGAVFASQEMIDAVLQLKQGEKLVDGDLLIAARIGNKVLDFSSLKDEIASFRSVSFSGKTTSLKNVWDIFSLNEQAIKEDFATITAGRKSAPIPDGVVATGKENIFLEEGAIIKIGRAHV